MTAPNLLKEFIGIYETSTGIKLNGARSAASDASLAAVFRGTCRDRDIFYRDGQSIGSIRLYGGNLNSGLKPGSSYSADDRKLLQEAVEEIEYVLHG